MSSDSYEYNGKENEKAKVNSDIIKAKMIEINRLNSISNINLYDRGLKEIPWKVITEEKLTACFGGNFITRVDFQKCPAQLLSLDLSGNRINYIDFNRIPESLKVIWLIDNELRTLDLSPCIYLKKLYIRGNKKTVIKNVPKQLEIFR